MPGLAEDFPGACAEDAIFIDVHPCRDAFENVDLVGINRAVGFYWDAKQQVAVFADDIDQSLDDGFALLYRDARKYQIVMPLAQAGIGLPWAAAQ